MRAMFRGGEAGNCFRGFWAAAFASLLLGAAGPAAAVERSPKEILEASGVSGGLVVQVGAEDGRRAAALCAGPSYVVHALVKDSDRVESVREQVRRLGLSGRISVDSWDGETLPYVDSLVNLLVVEAGCDLPLEEAARVLAPRGVLAVRDGSSKLPKSAQWTLSPAAPAGWRLLVRRVPPEIDDWTHFLHGPDGHAMSNDSAVGPPWRIQWIGSPQHSRSHKHLTTVNVMVSAGGRIFAVVDESPPALPEALPGRWALVARDAFNGVELWRKPLSRWQPSYVADRNSFPADLHRRLVASDDLVFATLRILGPVSALDARTGRIVRTYEATEKTEDIIHEDGVLYLSINTADPKRIDRLQMAYRHVEPRQKRVAAIEAKTGRVLWEKRDEDTDGLMPMTLAVKGPRLFFQNPKNVVALDKRTGEVIWRSTRPSDYFRPGWSSPTLVAFDDIVISADRQSGPGQKIGKDQFAAGGFSTGDLVVFSADRGQRLWSAPCAEGCRAPTDVFRRGDRLWFGQSLERRVQEYRQARDALTGRILGETAAKETFPTWHHHRCYRDKATCKYILGGRTGVEFIDLATGQVSLHNWVRGNCKFGVLPCNGLLYAPPDQCGCYVESKLTGFHALAPKRSGESSRADSHPFEKGPAYGRFEESSSSALRGEDWPTYRGDNSRSGCREAPATADPADLKEAWRTDLGGRLTPPVAANGRVFVASIDQQTLYVLDAETGQTLRHFIAGGRIDSPPTVAGPLAVFGCRDGWVYAWNYARGELAWRYRAAPDDDLLVDNGRVESVWPVCGSVLIQDGCVYFAAGRSSYVDGGVRMAKLDLRTGRPRASRTFFSRDPETGEAIRLYKPFEAGGRYQAMEMPGVLPDVLSSDGQRIWMRAVNFDTNLKIQPQFAPHLFSSMGFLDDSWWELSYWIYGEHMFGGRAGIARAIGLYPTGRILVFDRDMTYAYQEGYETIQQPALAAAKKRPEKTEISGGGKYRHVANQWRREVPLHVFGLVLAGDTLLAAGPPQVNLQGAHQALGALRFDLYDPPPPLKEAIETFQGRRGGLLCAVRKTDGETVMRKKLRSIPVFDGLIAAYGGLYMSATDGAVVRLK